MDLCEQHERLSTIIKDKKVGSFYSRLMLYSQATLNARIVHWVSRYGGLSNAMLRRIYYSSLRERSFSAGWLNCSVWLFHQLLNLEYERKRLWGIEMTDGASGSFIKDSLPIYLLLAYGMEGRVFQPDEIRWMIRHMMPRSLLNHWTSFPFDFEPPDEDWPIAPWSLL